MILSSYIEGASMKCAFELCDCEVVEHGPYDRGVKPKYCEKHMGIEGISVRYFDTKKAAIKNGFLPAPPKKGKYQFRYEDPSRKPEPIRDGSHSQYINAPRNSPSDWILEVAQGTLPFKSLKRYLKGVKVIKCKV